MIRVVILLSLKKVNEPGNKFLFIDLKYGWVMYVDILLNNKLTLHHSCMTRERT